DIGRLRHHTYYIEPQDLFHVIHTHHLSARDPPRVVSRQQKMFLHTAVALLRALRLAREQSQDTVGVADRGDFGIDDHHRAIGVIHREVRALFDTGRGVAEDVIEATGDQLIEYPSDALDGQRVLVARLRGG